MGSSGEVRVPFGEHRAPVPFLARRKGLCRMQFRSVRDGFATKGASRRSSEAGEHSGLWFGRVVVKRPGDLREQARRYRRLASGISDRRTVEAITELAAEYEAAAAAMERLNLIRKRAYQIWEEQGRPEGLHADHWHDAELQVTEGNEGEDPALGKP
jgi:hypothetical protein